jgi:tetratricopeptide (TPR) repeat protein
MPRLYLRPLLLVTLFQLVACALPQDRIHSQRFVPSPEMRAVKAYQEGLSLAARSRYVDAEFMFREALYFAPGQRNLRFNLAMVLEQMGNFPEALEILDQLLAEPVPKSDPLTSLEVRFAKGKLLVAEGDFEAGPLVLEQALVQAIEASDWGLKRPDANRQAPKVAWGLIARSLSALAFRLGDEQQALCYLRQSRLALAEGKEVERRVRVLIGIGRTEEAQQELSEYFALHRGSKDPQLLHYMSMIELAHGDMHAALDRARQALDSAGPGASIENENLLIRTLARKELERLGETVAEESTLGRKGKRAALRRAKQAAKDQKQAQDEADLETKAPEDDPAQMLALLTQLEEGNAQLYWPMQMIEGERALRAELEAQVAAAGE